MEILQDILVRLGVTGSVATALCFILRETFRAKVEKFKAEQAELTELRKSERDAQIKLLSSRIDQLEGSLSKHFGRHKETEQSLCGKIDKVYERLNPLCDSINRIQGYIEAKHGKD
jgi:predicted nuclease with TOPRIM domain